MGTLISCLAFSICDCACCLACSCCQTIFKGSLSIFTRFSHFLILVVVYAIAITLGKLYPDDINGYNSTTKVNLTGDCDSEYQDNCIYHQLIYRASLALSLVFAFLTVTTFISDTMNKSFWILKFGIAIALFISFWWADNDGFSGWAEFCRVISFFWLIIQGLLFLDVSHDIHDYLQPNDNSNEETADEAAKKIPYLILSFLGFAAGVLGLVFLFQDYTACGLGMFFTIVTLIVGLITTVVSLLDEVGRGLLTPCLMFGYSVFICWYALLSSPEEDCNPSANDVNTSKVEAGIVIISVISSFVMVYLLFKGTKILNIFNPAFQEQNAYADKAERDRVMAAVVSDDASPENGSSSPVHGSHTRPVEDSNTSADDEKPVDSGTPHERSFFHFFMFLVSCYSAMILTNWGKTDGSPVGHGSSVVGNESMWLKIVSQWVFFIFYARILQVSYMNNSTEENT